MRKERDRGKEREGRKGSEQWEGEREREDVNRGQLTLAAAAAAGKLGTAFCWKILAAAIPW